MKKSLFLLLLFLVVAVVAVSCASSGKRATFQSENQIGVEVHDVDGNSFFCAYDQKISSGQFSQESTCSFTAKKGGVVYGCEKLKLSNIGKDFRLETHCSIIIDLNEEQKKPPEKAVFRVYNSETDRVQSHAIATLRRRTKPRYPLMWS